MAHFTKSRHSNHESILADTIRVQDIEYGMKEMPDLNGLTNIWLEFEDGANQVHHCVPFGREGREKLL